MPFDQKVVHYLASLCRIQCTEKEEESLLQSLDKILNYIALLDEIDTSGVKPLSHVTESLHDAMRDDECGPPLGRQEYLQNAPAHTAGMIRVPPVLKN